MGAWTSVVLLRDGTPLISFVDVTSLATPFKALTESWW